MSRAPQPTWDDYVWRRRVFLVAFFGYLPVVSCIGFPLNALAGSDAPAIILALAWMGLFGFAGAYMSSFPCPRCGKPFFRRLYRSNPCAQPCLHCGFHKWEVPDRRRGGASAD